jgi:hypothetical protein
MNKVNKVAILQSNYIPWKGVFDMINQVDTFVFFEDVQFTKRDWRTRNQIKTQNGLQWITVPVKKAPREAKIYEIEIFNDSDWQRNHYDTIIYNYAKAPYFKDYKYILEEIYLQNIWNNLSEFNIKTTMLISKILGIKTMFVNSKDLNTNGNKDDKLIEICKQLEATTYLSGPAAQSYIDDNKFKESNINLSYINYEYPEYKQMYGSFNHYVTILDLLFNCGPDSPYYIWGWKEGKESGTNDKL